jgi:hypothetical protein
LENYEGIRQRLNNWRVGWRFFCGFSFAKTMTNRNTSS